MSHPFDGVVQDGVDVGKADLRAYMRSRTVLVAVSASEIPTFELPGTRAIILDGFTWRYVAGDTTSAHNPVAGVLVSADGRRFLRTSSGGGGSGAVDSVNGLTGDVILDAAAVGALADSYVPAWADVTGKPTTLAGYGITDAQPLGGDLTALEALSGTNIIPARTGANTWAAVAFAAGLTLTAGTLGPANDLAALEALSSTGYAKRTGADAWSLASTVPWGDVASTPTTLAGYGITDAQGLDTDLTALAGLSAAGLIARTGSGTAAARTLTAPAAGITVSNGGGVAGDPTLALANDLAALEALSGTGYAKRTGADTWSLASAIPYADLSGAPVNATTSVAGLMSAADKTKLDGVASGATANVGTVTSVGITAPAAGLTASGGPVTSSGAITLALADDLAALEALSSTGYAKRTGASTWSVSGTIPYSDLSGAPSLATVATTGAYTDLSGLPTLGTVAALSYPGGTSNFLRADGTWATPPGGGGGGGDMYTSVYDPTGVADDAFARGNHTGTQLAATISDFSTAADARISAAVGVSVQAYDADLTTWAGISPSANAQSLVSAANYAAMRALLDLEPGTDFYSISAANAAFQPLDSDLTTIAGLTATTDNFIVAVSSAWASRTPAQVRATLGLVVGTDVQAYDAELAAIAGLTSAADRLPYFTGSGTAALATFTAAGRALVDDADAAAQRATLGLGALATLGSVDLASNVTGDLPFANIAQIATARIVGRVNASTGDIEALTGTQATTLLDVFTSSLKGLAPASGGGTANFLRADGTWAAPSGASIPAGVVAAYGGATAPTGWLLCYGQNVSRTTYAALFTAIGTTYGVGDGSTTFGLPDLRGRVIAGQDDMGGTSANRLTGLSGGVDGDVLGGTGGAQSHTLITAEMPAHNHPYVVGNDSGTGGSGQGGTGLGAAASTDNTGGDAAHNNVQPTIILNYIICTG